MRTIAFVLRGCPAGWLGVYGNEWVATPNLDRVASEAVVFDHHLSDCPDPDAATPWPEFPSGPARRPSRAPALCRRAIARGV